jgi:hypothetical protein
MDEADRGEHLAFLWIVAERSTQLAVASIMLNRRGAPKDRPSVGRTGGLAGSFLSRHATSILGGEPTADATSFNCEWSTFAGIWSNVAN